MTLPSLAFVFWSPAGVLPRAQFGRLLAQFAAPVGVLNSLVAFGAYRFFLDRSGEVAYAQLALTYVLALSGLVVVLLVRPPVRRAPGRILLGAGLESSDRSGDKRPVLLVLVLLALFLVLAATPWGISSLGSRCSHSPPTTSSWEWPSWLG